LVRGGEQGVPQDADVEVFRRMPSGGRPEQDDEPAAEHSRYLLGGLAQLIASDVGGAGWHRASAPKIMTDVGLTHPRCARVEVKQVTPPLGVRP